MIDTPRRPSAALRGPAKPEVSLWLLRISAVMTLIALGLMCWSMLEPTPLPVMLAMSVGQGIGCLAFALYSYVVIRDLRSERRERDAP